MGSTLGRRSRAFPVTSLLHNTLRCLALLAGMAAISVLPANAQCPAVGADTNCGVVLTIQDIGTGRGTCSSTNCVSIANNQGPFDAIEDTLVGVVNSSKVLPIASLVLTSSNDIFGFDGDGICGISPNTGLPYPGPPGCPFGPTGYEGQVMDATGKAIGVVSFMTTTGTVNFNPAIPPGGTAYFSLENSLTAATVCSSVINNSVHHFLDLPIVDPVTGKMYNTRINATFLSNTNLSYTRAQAATLCGFTGWDWQQTVTNLPLPSPFYDAADVLKLHPLHAPLSFNDPPPDDYLGANPPSPAPLPLYFNPSSGKADPYSVAANTPDDFTLTFADTPHDGCLNGGSGVSCGGKTAPNTPTGKYVGFTTHLVGLIGLGPGYGIQDTGVGFSWTDTNNGTSGGISATRSNQPTDPGSGTGGITITMVNGVTSYQYPKSFGVSEINGNPVSSGSPAPPILLGTQIAAASSGLAYSRVTQTFNATVTITNISSSTIDGPFQIVCDSLTAGVTLSNATSSFGGWPYVTVPAVGSLAPGQSASVSVVFKNPSNAIINFAPVVYSGSFN